MKHLTILFALLLSLGGAFAQNDIDSVELAQDGPVEIDFWHIQATIYGEAITEIVASFNEQYDGQIRVTETFKGEYDELNRALRAALRGGGLPDVSMAYEGDVLEYMQADVVLPLDSYIESERHGLSGEELSDIVPAVLARQRLPSYEGRTMSWPHGNSSQGVYYNLDLLEQAGIDRPAETWAEFFEQLRTVQEATGTPGMVMSSYSLAGTLNNWLRTMGVDTISEDGQSADFDNEPMVQMLGWLQQGLQDGSIVFVEDTEQEFTNGRAAMEIGTTARTSSKLELIGGAFEWGITLIPHGEGEEPSTELYGGNQVLFESTPEEQLAGWLFLKYFAGPEAQAIYAEKTGYFPATLSSQETPLLSENYSTYPQKAQAFEEVFPYASITYPLAVRRTVGDAIQVQIETVLLGGGDPAQAATAMQVEAERILSRQ